MSPRNQLENYLFSLEVRQGKKIALENFATDYDHKMFNKKEGKKILKDGIKQLANMQDVFYADNRFSLLIVLQAMDAAGKDSAIKHVMSGFNPQGVIVSSFKQPSLNELDHDYFWRHYKALPGRGEIGIFNRSHYENVLVTRVHPEYVLNERIPGINSIDDIKDSFWDRRYQQINRFERNLYENGTRILKFFLHASKKEQKKRFLKRINKPEKNWKFSAADVEERKYWVKYQEAYSKMLGATSMEHAPWFVLPADDKWFTRVCIGAIIYYKLNELKLSYPELSHDEMEELETAKNQLIKD